MDLLSILSSVRDALDPLLSPLAFGVIAYVALVSVFAFLSLASGRVGKRARTVLKLLTRNRPNPRLGRR